MALVGIAASPGGNDKLSPGAGGLHGTASALVLMLDHGTGLVTRSE
jgi:hypothetical protein